MKTTSNIYPILNVSELSDEYRLVKIYGLSQDKNYQSNLQMLINGLSRKLRHPVTIIDRNEEPKLVIRNQPDIMAKLPNEFQVVPAPVYLKDSGQVLSLNFENPTIETAEICRRFLQFDIQGQLFKSFSLWTPGAGEPFFPKNPKLFKGVAIFQGFTANVVWIPSKGFGIAIDATTKFASPKLLPKYLPRETFNRLYKKKSLIYKYGSDWYEIQAMEVSDLNVTEYKVGGESLIEYLRNNIPKPHDQDLANLPSDSSVLIYYSWDQSHRAAPSGLCFEVLDFEDIKDKEISNHAIMKPHNRLWLIQGFKKEYFRSISFGSSKLKLADNPLELEQTVFEFPSFELGNGEVLSPNDFKGDVIPFKLAKERMKKICDAQVGFYSSTVLPNQFIALPRSVSDSMGKAFVDQLQEVVNDMYPNDDYNPQVVVYEDAFTNKPDYLTLGHHIIKAIQEQYRMPAPGFGIVMIPRLKKQGKKDHDKLGALLVCELEEIGFTTSIIHKETVWESFQQIQQNDGQIIYHLIPKAVGRFKGYLRLVALNKVLLNSNKYPFVLNEPLHADLTIGIDAVPKTYTAGFIMVDKYCKNITCKTVSTRNKERLSRQQTYSQIYEMIKSYCALSDASIVRKIVFHRDGRVFEPEIEGIFDAINRLKKEDILLHEVSVSIVEIPKNALASIRFFQILEDKNTKKQWVGNPQIGLHFYFGQQEAFICTTGKEFPHDGTSNPLNIRFTHTEIPKEEILSDIFKLSTLAYTKPDDCSRFPITIKLNDIRLGEVASPYDKDAFKEIQILDEDLSIISK